MEPIAVRGLLLRRAVLGILLAAGCPLTVLEVAAALHEGGVTTGALLTKSPSRVVADLLAYQATIGKVSKTGPATFRVVANSMSRSTRQRCLRWRLQVDQLRVALAAEPGGQPGHAATGSPLSDAGDGTGVVEPHSWAPGPPPIEPPPCLGPPLSDAGRQTPVASERGDPTHTAHRECTTASAPVAPTRPTPTRPTPLASERGDPAGTGYSAVGPPGESYPSPMFTVEPATDDDLEVLVEQGAALFREDAGVHDSFIDFTWYEREGRTDFERLIASNDCLVLVARWGATVVGHLVGYLHAASPTRLPVTFANLRSLYVTPGHRRRGVADRLTNEFIGWATARGCAEANVDSYASNEPAQQLYERHGFAVRSTARTRPLQPDQAGGTDWVASSHQAMPDSICSRDTPPA